MAPSVNAANYLSAARISPAFAERRPVTFRIMINCREIPDEDVPTCALVTPILILLFIRGPEEHFSYGLRFFSALLDMSQRRFAKPQ